MSEITRLIDRSDAIELDFVEGEATLKNVMKLALQLHLSGLSVSNSVSILDNLGVQRPRSTAHNWVQKSDLAPKARRDPDKMARDETFIKVTRERI